MRTLLRLSRFAPCTTGAHGWLPCVNSVSVPRNECHFTVSRGIEDVYELSYVRKDGSRVPAVVSVMPLRDAKERVIGYLSIATDNTQRQEAEVAQTLRDQRLRGLQFYTRAVIESTLDALMVSDRQDIITDVNRQMMTFTGYTRDELIGAPCKHFFSDPARIDAAIKRVLAEQHASEFELIMLAQNGKERAVACNAAAFHDGDRKLQGIVVAMRDATECKWIEPDVEAVDLNGRIIVVPVRSDA